MGKLKHILNSKSKTITAAAVIFAVATLASRLLGLIKIHLFAYFFGAGDIYDVYVAAFRLPDFLFLLLITGTLSAGLIPVFTDYLNKNEKQIWCLASNILNIIMLSILFLSAFFILIAPWLIPLIVPGFGPEKTALTINLTRLLLLQPIFLALSSIFSGILQSFKRFLITAIAPLLYNIGIILGLVFFQSIWGIYGVVYGVILGAFLQMLVQLPPIIYSGFRWQPLFNWRYPGLKRIIKLAPPRVLSLLVSQINIFVITIIASTLGKGRLSAFDYADLLQSFPVDIFGLSLAMAAFPTLADFLSQNKTKQFIHSLIDTLRQILFFMAPASVFIIILRAQIVRVILGQGAFDWTATRLTINCLQFFAIGMFAQATILLFTRAFYALENTKTPFIIGLVGAGINVIGCMILSQKLGIAGLALAFSIANIITALIFFIVLHFKVGYLDDWILIKAVLKIILASLIAGFVVYGMLNLMALVVNTRTYIGIATQGLVAAVCGIAAYVLICLFLQIKKMLVLGNLIKIKLKKIHEIRFF